MFNSTKVTISLNCSSNRSTTSIFNRHSRKEDTFRSSLLRTDIYTKMNMISFWVFFFEWWGSRGERTCKPTCGTSPRLSTGVDGSGRGLHMEWKGTQERIGVKNLDVIWENQSLCMTTNNLMSWTCHSPFKTLSAATTFGSFMTGPATFFNASFPSDAYTVNMLPTKKKKRQKLTINKTSKWLQNRWP